MSTYKVGQFKAKVKDYGISATQNDDPQVFVVFDVDFEDSRASMTWYGSLKAGKAREITLKALLALKFRESSLDILVDGPAGGGIEVGQEARVTTEENTFNEKTTVKIAWVNSAESQVKRLESSSARAKLAQLNLDGDFAKLKAQAGVSDEPAF